MKDWSEKAKRNQAMVMRGSVTKLSTDLMRDTGPAVGQVPIDTGTLRNSLMASTAAMPPVREGDFDDPSASIALAIAGAKVGDTIWLGFQAAYARRRNYGFTGTDALGRYYNEAGKFFVEDKASKWQSYVDEAAREIGV